MKRIIFTGGLGNQMFQYALMLSLKSKGIKVSPDTTTYESTITHNGFELEKNIQHQCDVQEEQLVPKAVCKNNTKKTILTTLV